MFWFSYMFINILCFGFLMVYHDCLFALLHVFFELIKCIGYPRWLTAAPANQAMELAQRHTF